jgi:hypothetical protein
MSLARQAGPVIAAALVAALLFGSMVVISPEGAEIAYNAQGLPTPYSADHAHAQATAKDEEPAPTF